MSMGTSLLVRACQVIGVITGLSPMAVAQPEPFYPRVNLTGWPHPGGCSANSTDSAIFNPFWLGEHRMGVDVKPFLGNPNVTPAQAADDTFWWVAWVETALGVTSRRL